MPLRAYYTEPSYGLSAADPLCIANALITTNRISDSRAPHSAFSSLSARDAPWCSSGMQCKQAPHKHDKLNPCGSHLRQLAGFAYRERASTAAAAALALWLPRRLVPPGILAAVRRAVHGNRFYRWPHTRVGQWLLAAHNVAYEQRTRIRRAETNAEHARTQR